MTSMPVMDSGIAWIFRCALFHLQHPVSHHQYLVCLGSKLQVVGHKDYAPAFLVGESQKNGHDLFGIGIERSNGTYAAFDSAYVPSFLLVYPSALYLRTSIQ